MDLLTQLNRAMEYIEANIQDDAALKNVSTVTMYSPYHFNRLFYYIADMPLSEYIRKRKLSLAAMDLQTGNEKVIDLALKYGYVNADSFTRAFSKQHGMTPSAARHTSITLRLFPPLTFQITIKGVQEMHWRIEKKEAFEVFGVEHIFSNGETGLVTDFWAECHKNGSYEKLFDAAGGIRSPDGHGSPRKDGSCVIYAVCGYREPGYDSFPYMICASKTPESKIDGFQVAQIPKATWAVFRSEPSNSIGAQIPVLFNRAYSEWLPSSGYDKSNGPDMELYYTGSDGSFYEEVWIPNTKK